MRLPVSPLGRGRAILTVAQASRRRSRPADQSLGLADPPIDLVERIALDDASTIAARAGNQALPAASAEMPVACRPVACRVSTASSGSRASLGMDVVLVGLLALLPVWPGASRRSGPAASLHKRLQLFIVAALAVAIVIFEIDIRIFSDWKVRARPSPYWPGGRALVAGHPSGLRGEHLRALDLGGLGGAGAVSRAAACRARMAPGTGGWPGWRPSTCWCTAVTGVVFYWLAFVA